MNENHLAVYRCRGCFQNPFLGKSAPWGSLLECTQDPDDTVLDLNNKTLSMYSLPPESTPQPPFWWVAAFRILRRVCLEVNIFSDDS